MESHSVRLSLAGMTSLMFFAIAPLLGFSSMVSTAAASSPIDEITTGRAATATTMSDNTSFNVTSTINVEWERSHLQ